MTTIDNEIEFGVNDRQLWFLWKLRERTRDELEAALDNGGDCSSASASEMEETSIHTYPAGPWHAGLEPFPNS